MDPWHKKIKTTEQLMDDTLKYLVKASNALNDIYEPDRSPEEFPQIDKAIDKALRHLHFWEGELEYERTGGKP